MLLLDNMATTCLVETVYLGSSPQHMIFYDKVKALNQLRHQKNAFILSLVGAHLLRTDGLLSLKDEVIVFKRGSIIFSALASDREGSRLELDMNDVILARDSPTDFDTDLRELIKFARRNSIKEAFETVKAFADQNNLMNELRGQEWFRYARIIRNAISHNLHFEFDKYDLKAMPITWNGITISESLDKTEMQEDVLDYETTVLLILAMRDFVNSS
jgi:hypothetical protein